MGVTTFKRKTFPIWHQDSTANPNYASEYKRCLGNLPITTNTPDFSVSGVIPNYGGRIGSVLGPNGKVYLMPYNATNVGYRYNR